MTGISDVRNEFREKARSGINSHTLSFGFTSTLRDEEIEIYGDLAARTQTNATNDNDKT